MAEIPSHWTNTPLSDLLVTLESGSRPKGGVRGIAEGVVSVGGEHLTYEGGFDFTRIKYVPRNFGARMSKGHIREHDILVVKDGATTGKTAYVDKEFPFRDAVINEHVFLCRLVEDIEPKFIFCFLTSREGQKRILDNFKGSAQGGINRSFAPNTEVPLAPLAEQRRIAAKLDKLLSKANACRKRLEKIPAILRRFRQSVLAAACSGRLTKDWRKLHPRNTEAPLQEDETLPEGWRWVALEKLVPPDGLFDGPFGSNLKTSDYTNKGVRVVRLENIGHLRFIAEKESYVSQEKYETLRRHTVQEGDIIFASFIADEIRVCVLPELTTTAIAKADCFCLRPYHTRIDRQFLTFQLASYESYVSLAGEVHGATRPRVNLGQLRALRVRVCPLPEQREIARRVDNLFKLADTVEARYQKAKAVVDKLTQSILAKAFRGELISQDPDDLPAEKLLERIRRKWHTDSATKLKETRLRSKKTHAKC